MKEETKYKLMCEVGSEGQYLGSLKWPPRSYCCSFCSREFRSAQALGGHMNVHRRDRARLKQLNNHSRICPNEDFNLDHVPINHYESADKLITWVAASSSSSGSGSEGEHVPKKQKLYGDLTVQITTEEEDDQDSDDPNPASFKHNIQKVVEVKEFGAATKDLDLELRL